MSNIFSKAFGKKDKRLGLALGGGGAKGGVHLGALRAFEEEGIEFDVISGTSVGSIIGALYARGLSWREIEGMISSAGLSDLKSFVFARLAGGGIDDIISLATGNLDFAELKKPFGCVAVDLFSGEEKVFTEGNLAKALGASSAIPPYFGAVTIDGKQYLDGCYRNIIPCDVAVSLGADYVVGIDLSMNRQSTENGKKLLDELYPNNNIPVSNPSKAGYEACNFMLAPDLSKYTATSFEAVGELFDIGYFLAKEQMPDVKKSLEEAGVRNFKKVKNT